MLQKKRTQIFDELSQEYLTVTDRVQEFEQLSILNTPGFNEHKNNFAALKNNQFEKLKGNIGPVPGGVGFGTYYERNFQSSFTNLAVLDFSIVVAEILGGNVIDFLYLTATNTTAKGVEAYVSYFAQNLPEFLVYDWSVPEEDKWKLRLAYNSWSKYLFNGLVNNIPVRLLRVINYTELISGTTWQNNVCLYNDQNKEWDCIYNRTYSLAANTDQQDEFNGSWGPIVETFQINHGTLNPVGFKDTRLYNDTDHPDLDNSNSFIRDDPDDGIENIYFEANHTFLIS